MQEWHKSTTFREALRNALVGFRDLYRQEANIRRQTVLLLLVVILGAFIGISHIEFALIFIVSGLVLGLEFLNSALEEVEDMAWPEYSEAIKRSKDIAAGAVLIASVAAVAVGALIFIPHLVKLLLLVY